MKADPGLGVVLVDHRVEPGTDVQGRVGRVADREQHRAADEKPQGAAVVLIEMAEQADGDDGEDGVEEHPLGDQGAPGEGRGAGPEEPQHRRAQLIFGDPDVRQEGDQAGGGQQSEQSRRTRPVGEHGEDEEPLQPGAHHDRNQAAQAAVGEPGEDQQAGNDQQAEQVQPAAEAEQVGDEKQPAVVHGAVPGPFPVQDQPEPQGDEQYRVAVDLGLGGVEPEGVGDRQGQRGQGGPEGHREVAVVAEYPQRFPAHGAARYRRGAEVGAPYGQGGGEGRHKHHAPGDLHDRDHGEQPSEQHVQRRARRMRNAEGV